MNRFTSLLALALCTPAFAQEAPTSFTQAPAYKECTNLATTNPVAAQAKAEEWLKIDDSIGAHHCMAMAFYGQRHFAEAANELSIVRTKIPPSDLDLRTYVARQGAKAWLDGGRPDAAVTLLAQQINDMSLQEGDNATEAKLTAELLLDRARVNVTYGKLTEAVQDLDHAVSLAPTNEDVLLERASAFRQLNDVPLAKQDLQSVMKLNPKNARATEMLQALDKPTS